MQIKLTKLEKETIICYNEEEAFAEVFTYNEPLKKRLASLAEERPQAMQLFRSSPYGSVEYRMPKSWVRINPSRVISDEQRAKLAVQAKEKFCKSNQRADLLE